MCLCVAALEDMEAGLGLTNHLEELRKEGGDKWLSILNASKVGGGAPHVQCIQFLCTSSIGFLMMEPIQFG